MNDPPWIEGFWTDRARAALPNLAWAIDEISPSSGLDTLCVELEVIAGQSAYHTRALLLQRLSDERYVDPASRIQTMSLGSLRLGVWCMIELLDSIQKFPDTRVSYVVLDQLRRWCAGQVRDTTAPVIYDNARFEVSRLERIDINSDTCKFSELVLGTAGCLFFSGSDKFVKENIEASVYKIVNGVRRLLAYVGPWLVDPMLNVTTDRAILSFPVYER